MRSLNLPENTMTADRLRVAQAQAGISGMRLVVSPYVPKEPKIKLSQDFKWCSAEFRSQFNQWLLDQFGTKDCAYMFNETIVMSPEMAAQLEISLP